MLNKDTISAIVLLAVSGIFWRQSSNLTELGAFFPKVIIVVLVALSIILLIQSFIKEDPQPAFAGVEARKILPAILGIISYIGIMLAVGFVISSILFLAVMFKFLDNSGKLGYIKSVSFAFAVTVAFYGVFYYGFKVPLPVGILFGG